MNNESQNNLPTFQNQPQAELQNQNNYQPNLGYPVHVHQQAGGYTPNLNPMPNQNFQAQPYQNQFGQPQYQDPHSVQYGNSNNGGHSGTANNYSVNPDQNNMNLPPPDFYNQKDTEQPLETD